MTTATHEATVEQTSLTTDDGLTLAATWHRLAVSSADESSAGDSSDEGMPTGRTPKRPVVIAVHGYPDDQRVWDAMIPHLIPRADVLTYDTRGSGRSDAPPSRDGYALDKLRRDVDRAVTAAAENGHEVHLLAHDWGSIQAWQAVTDDGAASCVSSFTTISGPCLDHASRWMHAMARGSTHDRLLLAQQAASSTYIAFFQTPLLPELVIRSGAFGRLLQRGDGAEREHRDMLDGLELYRANMGLRRHGSSADATSGPRRTDVPTQIVVPTKDRYVREPIATYGAAYAATSRVRRLDAGHWAVRSHAGDVADLVIEHAGL